jgi:predicted nucleotidyltransferase
MARSAPTSALRYPLTTVLGTEANVRVLRDLARHGGQLSAPTITTRTGLARSVVWKALAQLVESGIVSAAGSGRAQLYALRSNHPLGQAIDELFAREERRFDMILDGIRSSAKDCGPGVIAVWIFGSVARGEDRMASDLDIAIVTADDQNTAIMDQMRDALSQSGETLAFRPSVVRLTANDVVRHVRESDPLWAELVRDALVLLGPCPEDLARQLGSQSKKRGAA